MNNPESLTTDLLPFETTPQIIRYLRLLITLEEEFCASDTGDTFSIDTYSNDEQVTLKSEGNVIAFWKYLEETGSIVQIHDEKYEKSAIVHKYTNMDQMILYYSIVRIQIIDIAPINTLLESIIHPTNNAIKSVSFDTNKSLLAIDRKTIQIPRFTYQDKICAIMFSRKTNTPVSWDVINDKIIDPEKTGHQDSGPRNRKRVEDALRDLNQKINKEIAPSTPLFEWVRGTIYRRY